MQVLSGVLTAVGAAGTILSLPFIAYGFLPPPQGPTIYGAIGEWSRRHRRALIWTFAVCLPMWIIGAGIGALAG